MLMFDIFYIVTKLEMEDVHAEAAMRETGEGSKCYEKTAKQQEERRKKMQIDKKNFKKDSWMKR